MLTFALWWVFFSSAWSTAPPSTAAPGVEHCLSASRPSCRLGSTWQVWPSHLVSHMVPLVRHPSPCSSHHTPDPSIWVWTLSSPLPSLFFVSAFYWFSSPLSTQMALSPFPCLLPSVQPVLPRTLSVCHSLLWYVCTQCIRSWPNLQHCVHLVTLQSRLMFLCVKAGGKWALSQV